MNRFACGAAAMCAVSSVACAAEHTTDSVETVKKGVADGKAVLVDVREDAEWKEGHLKDARLLPLSDIRKGVPAEKLKKTLPAGSIVYLHCGSGIRCLTAAELLKKQGYDVRPLKDGYEGLLKAGFPPQK